MRVYVPKFAQDELRQGVKLTQPRVSNERTAVLFTTAHAQWIEAEMKRRNCSKGVVVRACVAKAMIESVSLNTDLTRLFV
jgi:hypothetical protein